MKNKKDLVSLRDLNTKDVFDILKKARQLKKRPLSRKDACGDKTLALLFQKPSNRTRISFEVAMVHLGGYVLYLSPREIDMGARESVKDVARVVSRYVDCIVARVFSHGEVEDLAHYSDVPVINGLSDKAHPCQALSDVFTIIEKKGNRNVTVAYVGDGNNVLNSLIMACAKTGINVKVASPPGYEPDQDIFAEASEIAASGRSRIEKTYDPHEAVRGADIVYTDVWVSMGQESEREKRMKDLKPFQVNESLMRSTGKESLIMHCLPAHRGEEITDVIDGKRSIVYDQAENRMHVQKAVLLRLLG